MILAPKRIVANDVLSIQFIKVKSYCTLDEAIEKMLEENLAEVFVVTEDDHLMGVLTLKDISDIKLKHDDTSKAVKEFINENFVAINGFTPLARCRDIMLKKRIGRLPVIDEDKIIGVIRSTEIRDNFYMKMEEFSLQLKNIINSIHEAVCVVDHNGDVVVWNKNAEKLYGVASDDIVGNSLEEFFQKQSYSKPLKQGKRLIICIMNQERAVTLL